VQKIERSTVNAWDEKRVVDAVKATGRKKLIVTGISTDVCLAFPAMAALADGFQSYAVIDASGGFSQTQVDMGILRMQQAGVIPVGYSNAAIEILADNAAPEAEAVYAALGMPFSALVFGLRQYYSQASVVTGNSRPGCGRKRSHAPSPAHLRLFGNPEVIRRLGGGIGTETCRA
jgi:hypothetical protein